jgi:hypothetical protein
MMQVLVLGRPPFHDTELTTSGQLAYVGGNWTRDIAFAGTSIPLTVRAATMRSNSSSSSNGLCWGSRLGIAVRLWDGSSFAVTSHALCCNPSLSFNLTLNPHL